MMVVRAGAMGLCFGVRDALAVAFAQSEPSEVTLHGQLVHNEEVLARLSAKGFPMTAAGHEQSLPATRRVLVTAHGISEAERSRLEAGGKELLDTTCPLVRRVHAAAKSLHDEGRHVIVIGHPGHVEVRGIVGDLFRYDVVSKPEEARPYPSKRLGVVCQTTFMTKDVQRILQAVRSCNHGAEISFVDTVCEPTKQRIAALDTLLSQVEAVVVVGGKNSNNTRQLASACEARGVLVHLVQGPADLDASWFEGLRAVGLTAGTSTLPETVDAVHEALVRIDEVPGRRVRLEPVRKPARAPLS